MKEGGFYNTHARPQRQAVELVTGQAEEQLVAQLNSPTASPLPSFTIVDYGSSQGRNSLGLFQRLLSTFRRMHPTTPVTLVHEDVAANDWTSLFTTSTPRALADAHTFVLASGTSISTLKLFFYFIGGRNRRESFGGGSGIHLTQLFPTVGDFQLRLQAPPSSSR